MADRKVVADLNLNSPLHPVARPTDSYYRVQPETVQLEGGGEFADLARSIGIAVPVIQKELSEEQKYQQEEAVKEGATARLKNQKSFKEAVQSGQLRQAENPWFVKGYMQQDGRISGMNYDEAMRTAWAQSDVKNSDDPNALQKFMGEFRTKWISENDGKTPDWMDGFAPKMAQADNNMAAQHVAHRMKVIEDTAKENHGIEMRKLQDRQTELEQGLHPSDPLVAEGRRVTALQMQEITADFVRKGMDGKDANRIIADQVITKGIEMRDTDYARSILDQIKTPGGSVSKISDVSAKLQSAEETIRDRNWQDKQRAHADEDRPYQVAQRNFGLEQIEKTKEKWAKDKISEDRTERVRARTNELTAMVLAGQTISQQDYIELAKLDASSAQWVRNFRHSDLKQNAEIIPDQQAIARMMSRIAYNPESVTLKDVFSGVRPGGWDAGTAMQMWHEKQKLEKPGMSPISRDHVGKTLLEGLTREIVAPGKSGLPGSAVDASNAELEFSQYYTEVQADNKLSPSAKTAALRAKQLELLKHYDERKLRMTQTAKDAGLVKKTVIRGEGEDPNPKPVRAPEAPIPPAAIKFLIQNPNLADDFEKQFKLPKGSASSYINRYRETYE